MSELAVDLRDVRWEMGDRIWKDDRIWTMEADIAEC